MALEEIADSAVLLLRAMKYKCELVPTKLIIEDFKVRLVDSELVRWKRKMKEVLGMEGGTKSFVPFNHQTQADMVLVEEKGPVPLLDEQVVREVEAREPVNTLLPKPPEPKRGVFSRVEGTPY